MKNLTTNEQSSSPTKFSDTTVKEISLDLGDGVSMEFVAVPAGEFLMGSNPELDIDAEANEQPQHSVFLDDYWIGKYPVTNRQYYQFVTLGKGVLVEDGWEDGKYIENWADHPVIGLSWVTSKKFCKWLSKKTKKNIALPSEAQWEKAARGTDGRIYPWGNESPELIFPNSSTSVYTTGKVGCYPLAVSPYGAQDMTVNVMEWVADWYGENYYLESPLTNPTGPETGDGRALRGGSWLTHKFRSAYRTDFPPKASCHIFGFRCAALLF